MIFSKAPFRIRAPRFAAVAADAAPPPTSGDPYLTRLVKLVPAEVVTLYITFKTMAAGSSMHLGGWVVVCFVLVVLARTIGTREPGRKIQWTAAFVAAVSFVLWVYSTGGYFPRLSLRPGDEPIVSIVIGVWTFVVPWFYKGD
jgi:hypothetical protein